MRAPVAIIMGSQSDWRTMRHAAETLDALESIGYQGWLAMECGLSAPVADVLPRVARLLSGGRTS